VSTFVTYTFVFFATKNRADLDTIFKLTALFKNKNKKKTINPKDVDVKYNND